MLIGEWQTDPITLALRQRIAARDFRIPLLPEIAWKVVRIANDPESNTRQLVDLVRSDQTLAASIMRVANSAAYWRGTQLSSLPLAVARLGTALVRDIAFATAINARMFDAAVFDRQIRQTAHHALAAALWAKELAQLTRRDPETAFLCGLLHSIGKPILLRAALDIESLEPSTVDVDALMKAIDCLYAEAGAIALEHWRLPATVISAISHQHQPQGAPNCKAEACIIQAAKKLGSYTLTGEPTREELETLEVFPRLGLHGEQVEALLTRRGHVRTTLDAIRG